MSVSLESPTDAAHTNFADRLKAETRELHTEAEQHPFQKALMAGTLDKSLYIQQLQQMLLVRSTLEHHLKLLLKQFPDLASLITPTQFRESDIAADLKHFGGALEGLIPTSATLNLIRHIDRAAKSNSHALVGFHYVLEGANNGGRFIARAVRQAYALPERDGTMSIDPYGEDQTRLWKQFRTGLRELTLTNEQADAIVEAAKTLFRGLTALSDDLFSGAETAAT